MIPFSLFRSRALLWISLARATDSHSVDLGHLALCAWEVDNVAKVMHRYAARRDARSEAMLARAHGCHDGGRLALWVKVQLPDPGAGGELWDDVIV